MVVAAAAAVAGLAVVTAGSGTGRRAGAPADAVVPPLLSGVPAHRVGTDLVIGGSSVWRLTGAGRSRAVLGGSLSRRLSRLPGGASGAQISQLLPARGGVVAVMGQRSPAPSIGHTAWPVLFIPAGAGPARLIARASAVAIAPGGQAVWLQTASFAGTPATGTKAVMSPTFAVSLAGRRLSPVLHVPLGLVAATSAGLLTDSVVTGRLQLWSLPAGRPQRLPLPGGAQVAGASAGRVIWQSPSCAVHCLLHLTGLRAGGPISVAVPPGWQPALYPGPAAASGSGQRLVIPMDRVGSGYLAAVDLYVINITAQSVRRVPGGPYTIPQAPGPGDPGLTLASTWDQEGRLWVLAGWGDGYFQLGYWTGTGPLHVYPPAPGNPVAISAPARLGTAGTAYLRTGPQNSARPKGLAVWRGRPGDQGVEPRSLVSPMDMSPRGGHTAPEAAAENHR